MKYKSLNDLPEACRKNNPQLFGVPVVQAPQAHPIAVPIKRLRQSSKPLLNKLEAAFWEECLKDRYPGAKPQALKFRLGNGVTYCPDFVDLSVQPVKCWECKGPHSWDDALVKLKLAASIWKEVRWMLVWRHDGAWQQQEVLP